MDDAAGVARTASEAIRALNHALAAPGSAVGVPEVYWVVGELTVLARQLEQTTRDLHVVLAAALETGRLGLASGTAYVSVDEAVATAVSELAFAGEVADRLAVVLATGQQALAAVTDRGIPW